MTPMLVRAAALLSGLLSGQVPPTMALAEASRECDGQTACVRGIAKAIELDAR